MPAAPLSTEPPSIQNALRAAHAMPLRRLLRHFAIVALLAIAAVLFALGWGYRVVAEDDLVRQGARANVTLGLTALNVVEQALDGRLETLGWLELPAAALPAARFVAPADAALRRALQGTSVVKVKLYDVRGLTVYSTELKQIGEDKSATPAMQAVLSGESVTALSYRNRFNAVEGDVFDRNLLSTYHPLKRADGRVFGAIEVYDDLTPLIASLRSHERRLLLLAAGTLMSLYGLLLWLAARGARVIGRQQAQIETIHADLAEASRAAAQASRAKSAFLANMSHEIRTPMNGVLGMAELLQATPLNEQQLKFARTIRGSARALMGLLNDILDLSKIEAGRLRLDPHPFDLRAALDECLELMAPRASQKGVRLASELPPGGGAIPVVGDVMRLQQVVNNLLGNAIKFTAQGEVRLNLQRETDSGAPHSWHIDVRDSGIGIDADTQARLFEPFGQADSGTARRHGGSGLGLAISRELVHAMGGSIAVESRLGAGATFTVQVVLPPAASLPPPVVPMHRTMPPVTAPARRLSVLVVEDNPVNQVYAQAQLEALGHRVHLADRGEHALDLLDHEEIDLVLMDCHMPGMDGYAATRSLRARELADPSRPRLRIVALTASAMSEDQQRCIDAGMDGFMSKPFTRDQLARVVEGSY